MRIFDNPLCQQSLWLKLNSMKAPTLQDKKNVKRLISSSILLIDNLPLGLCVSTELVKLTLGAGGNFFHVGRLL